MIVFYFMENMQPSMLAPIVMNIDIEMKCSLIMCLEKLYVGFPSFPVFNKCTIVRIWPRR